MPVQIVYKDADTDETRTGRPVGGQQFTQEIEKTCLVWSRRHQTLNKNGETRLWARVHQGGGARH